MEKIVGIIGGSGFEEILRELGQTKSNNCLVGKIGEWKANVYAMKEAGVTHLISIGAVGSVRGEIKPGELVIADKFINLPKNGPYTFFDKDLAVHVPMARPTCFDLNRLLFESSQNQQIVCHPQCTYACIEGPQFSTLAESQIYYRQWGVDVIGKCNAREAKLAREAEMHFATICIVTDKEVLQNLKFATEKVWNILLDAIPKIAGINCSQGCDMVGG